MSVTYKHKSTGATRRYAAPMPVLEKSPGWERVEDKPAGKSDRPVQSTEPKPVENAKD